MLYRHITDCTVLPELVQMMRKHIKHIQLRMQWMLTVAVQNSELQDL